MAVLIFLGCLLGGIAIGLRFAYCLGTVVVRGGVNVLAGHV